MHILNEIAHLDQMQIFTNNAHIDQNVYLHQKRMFRSNMHTLTKFSQFDQSAYFYQNAHFNQNVHFHQNEKVCIFRSKYTLLLKKMHFVINAHFDQKGTFCYQLMFDQKCTF